MYPFKNNIDPVLTYIKMLLILIKGSKVYFLSDQIFVSTVTTFQIVFHKSKNVYHFLHVD